MGIEKILKTVTPSLIIGILTYYGFDEILKYYPSPNTEPTKIITSIFLGATIGPGISTYFKFYK